MHIEQGVHWLERALRCLAMLSICCFLFSSSLTVSAQTPTATIDGRVLDPTSALLPGVTVDAVDVGTNIRYSAKTNNSGFYSIVDLPPGNYRVEVSKAGFKAIVRPGVVLHVQDVVALNFDMSIGSTSEIVTVQGGTPLINTENAAVGTVIDRHLVEALPLNGRSFNTLLQLTPGVVIAPQAGGGAAPGQFSIAGQRTDANNFTVDGVSANFGVSNGSALPGESGTGTDQAFSAIGGTSSLVSVDALQEFRIDTSSYAPEFGRTPGGQVSLTTRSGTNTFHGGVYEYFRNDVLDANDWFANTLSAKPHAPERHNDFGGFVGGPIHTDRTFFFFSYEEARLKLPQTALIQVPSVAIRASAPASLAPFFNAYPQPNGPVSAAGDTAQFIGTYSNQATLDAFSMRVDHHLTDKVSIFGRYNYAPSEFTKRTGALSLVYSGPVDTQTATVGLDMALNSRMSNAFRANYSTQKANTIASLDSFGGAVPLDPSLMGTTGPNGQISSQFFPINSQVLQIGPIVRKKATQYNAANDLSFAHQTHQFKVGADYRAILLDSPDAETSFSLVGTSVASLAASSKLSSFSAGSRIESKLLTPAFSLYAQDTWKATSRLTLTYGVRWELSPPPSSRGATILTSWQNIDNPAQITPAPANTPLWQTTYGNFAPRLGIAYRLTESGDLVVRAGGGIFYDVGIGAAANVGSAFPNNVTVSTANVPLPVSNFSAFVPTPSLQPPYPGTIYAFDPNLDLPRSYQWNLAVEKSFKDKQALSLTYLGQAGRRLIRQEALAQPNSSFRAGSIFDVTQNDAYSNYDALEVQYRKPLAAQLQVLANYSWSHSLDNSSNDVVSAFSDTVISGKNDYASSDFDVRNSFSGALTYEIASPFKSGIARAVSKDWMTDLVIVSRSGTPFNASSTAFIIAGKLPRPNLVTGQPFWVPNPTAGGGRSLNPAAFTLPPSGQQGSEPRNDIPGFALNQIDLSLGRKFVISDRINLTFRTDAFNILNHPSFLNPQGCVACGPAALQSAFMLNQGLGGLNPLFQEGGPRSLQLSLKLLF